MSVDQDLFINVHYIDRRLVMNLCFCLISCITFPPRRVSVSCMVNTALDWIYLWIIFLNFLIFESPRYFYFQFERICVHFKTFRRSTSMHDSIRTNHRFLWTRLRPIPNGGNRNEASTSLTSKWNWYLAATFVANAPEPDSLVLFMIS